MCLLALLLDAPALYVPGIGVVLLAAVAPAWVLLSSRGARVQLDTEATIVEEDQRVEVAVVVTRGALPFPEAELVQRPGADAVRPRGRREEHVAWTAPSRRGNCTFGPAQLRVADPLGIYERTISSEQREVLVLPRVQPLRFADGARLIGLAPSAREAALEFDSLRPHRGGPSSRIHWPTVARTGVMMERRLTAEPDPRVLVLLDAYRPASELALDEALRATASLCVHLSSLGGCLLLLPGDRRASVVGPDLTGWSALHARLALVQPGARPPRDPQPDRSRTLFYVTASDASAGVLARRCYRVSPNPVPGRQVAFTVAGCSGQMLGADSAVEAA
jgi:uncharacterized protein (DUF58 family)